MQEDIRTKLKEVGFNRSCIRYIDLRFARRGIEITVRNIKEVDEDELLTCWLSMKSVANFIKSQINLK